MSNPEIPTWVKSVAKDWGNGGIDDSTFVNAIQFLVDHGIIKLPTVVCPTSAPVQPEGHITKIGVSDTVQMESN